MAITLKFIAVDTNGNISPIESGTFIVVDNVAPVVNATKEGDTITLTATDNLDPTAKIYYTLDGSNPTTNSTPDNARISLPPGTTTICFIAADSGGNISLFKKGPMLHQQVEINTKRSILSRSGLSEYQCL